MIRLVHLELDPVQRITRDLLAYTGLRVTPICTLRVGDVQFSPHVTAGVVSPGAIRSVGKGQGEQAPRGPDRAVAL